MLRSADLCLAELLGSIGVLDVFPTTSPAMSCHNLQFEERVWRWMFSHIGLGKHLMAGQRLSTYSLPLHVFLLSYYLDWLHAFLLSFL